jgi:sugar phosphate isomerase/epimerase
LRLTYCGNVHPAESLDDWLAVVENHAAVVTSRHGGGMGVWWNGHIAAELARSAVARERVRATLAECSVEIWTLNVFPFGAFHAERVKEGVYRPDWAEVSRLRYTLDAAAAVCDLVPGGTEVALSTLPLGFGAVDREVAVEALWQVAERFEELEQRTGVRCVLALEPEPFCILETAAATADFLEHEVFGHGADSVRRRRHLGVCIDLCHLAVVREDPLEALRDLAARGIAVPKIQVSSCLELRDPAALPRLLAFDESRYLHQSVADTGLRALDLGDVAARSEEFAAAGTIRTHFHVPVYWDDDALGSTRAEVERLLAGLRSPVPLLEVETYTWSVLGEGFGAGGELNRGLERELDFVKRRLPGGAETT